MMIPFDTWNMQSMKENIFFDEKFDLQMTLNFEKTALLFFGPFFRHLGREYQLSKMIALPFQYSS